MPSEHWSSGANDASEFSLSLVLTLVLTESQHKCEPDSYSCKVYVCSKDTGFWIGGLCNQPSIRCYGASPLQWSLHGDVFLWLWALKLRDYTWNRAKEHWPRKCWGVLASFAFLERCWVSIASMMSFRIEAGPNSSKVSWTAENLKHLPTAWRLNTIVLCINLADKFEADALCLIFAMQPCVCVWVCLGGRGKSRREGRRKKIYRIPGNLSA